MTHPPLKSIVALGAGALALWCALGPLPQPLGTSAAVVLMTLTLWSTALIPPFLTALVFFAAVTILGLMPPTEAFAGFGSAAVWLIVSGFVIGSAIQSSGLGARLAGWLAPVAGHSYVRLITVLGLAATLLGFVMPSSMGRAVVLVPIGMALAERMGFGPGSNGRIGVAVTLTLTCNMPSFAILPANIPNMILSGAAETLHGAHLGYLDYLALHYPLMGLAKAALIIWLVVRLFPDREGQPALASPETPTPSAPDAEAQQRRLALILLVTLGFWMTDALHGVGPAWVGLAAAVLLLMPRVGMVAPRSFNGSVDFGILLFVSAALGLGALVNSSGLGAVVGRGLETVLPLAPGDTLGQSFVNFMSLSVMSTLTGVVTTTPGVPTVLSPMAPDLAAQTGLSLQAVLMTQVVGFATVLFPYQVGPLVVAMQLSGERLGHVVRITLPLAAITVLVLMPLDWLWWRLLGWL